MPLREEVVLPLTADAPTIRHVRSTLLIQSLASIREQGLDGAYLSALPSELHADILNLVAGAWVPVDLAHAHYAAMDSLRLSPDTRVALGRSIGEKIRGTLLGTAVSMAKQVGVTPWTLIPHLQRFWNRGVDGGSLCAWRLGPKEARLDGVRASVLNSPYFRDALRGTAMSVFDLFCKKSYMREQSPESRADASVSYRVQWV